MQEIIITEKPDTVSWEDIHLLLLEAHKQNIKKGIVNIYAQMSGDKIKEKLGKEGRCWVAMDGDQLVGTVSVHFFIGRNWWNKGQKVAHSCFAGIIQKYQGIGILGQLNAKLVDYSKEHSVSIIEGDAAENNHAILKVSLLGGYKAVDFFTSRSKHYSIKIAKWYGECPFTDQYINRRYKISEKLTRWQYKPGKIERSLFVSLFCRTANKLVKYYYGE